MNKRKQNMTLLTGNGTSHAKNFYVKAADFEAVFFILQHMRISDRKEILATEFDDDLERIARKFTDCCDWAWVFCNKDGKAIAFLGAAHLWPNVAQIGFIATDDWSQIASTVSRWLYKMQSFILQHYKISHLFCFMDKQHKKSEKWLRWLGFKSKGILENFGKNKEDLVIMTLNAKNSQQETADSLKG